MPIYWTQFDWPSFAMLATGLAAVAAATIIGCRQTVITERQAGIAENQTKILARQVTLAELTLRHEMFDRRYVIFEDVQSFLGNILREGTTPDASGMRVFWKAMGHSRFLFAPPVYAGLERIKEVILDHYPTQGEMEKARNLGTQPAGELFDKEDKFLMKIKEEYDALVDLFGDELKLSGR